MRKADVLAYIHQQATYLTARDIAEAFREPVAHAGSVLHKLNKQGLVERAYTQDGRIVSAISTRGIQRLAWWQDRAQQEQEDALGQEDTEFAEVAEGQLEGQQFKDEGEASQNDAPDETAAEPDGLARFFRPR